MLSTNVECFTAHVSNSNTNQNIQIGHFMKKTNTYTGGLLDYHSSSVPEGKLMGVELIGVYKSGSINWG